MRLRERIAEKFFGSVIEAKVKERLRATSVTDEDESGWRRLTGSTTRDLSPLKQERMIEIAYYLWEATPLGRWLIEITKDFILAEGLPYECKNDQVKKVLDDFWYDPINRMDLYAEKFVRELFLYGELCLPVFVGEQTGRVRLGYIDPAQIDTVVTDPENVKIVTGVITKATDGYKEKKYRTILPQEAESFLSQKAQAERQGYRDGECFFFAVNNVTNSPRGRSELLTVADWIDALEQFMFDYADKWPLLNTFVWDLMVEGGDEKTINEQLRRFTKKAGSVFGHNEKVKLEEKTPKLQAVDAEVGARLFRNHILGGTGFPEHWFGGGGDVNRATAAEMGTPTFKMLKSKQKYVKYIFETIFDFVITKALEAKYLRVPEEEAYDYSVITPEISPKDVTKYSAALQQISTALGIAEANGWIDKETAQKSFAVALGFLGIEVDVETMRNRAEEEEERKGYEGYE